MSGWWWMVLLGGPTWVVEPTLPALPANFGVEAGRLAGGERYALGGRQVSRAQAFQALGAADGRLPDDAGKLRVVIIGPADVRKAAVAALKSDAALAPWRGRVIVQDYDPDHWHVTGAGYWARGKPTVYALRPDGVVLHRQDDWSGPADFAAVLRRVEEVTKLRRPAPDYDPAKDPDLRAAPAPAPGPPPAPAPAPDGPGVPWSLVLLGLGGVGVFLRRVWR